MARERLSRLHEALAGDRTCQGFFPHWQDGRGPQSNNDVDGARPSMLDVDGDLLEVGVKYVLTFKYSSNYVESLFSVLRQLNRSNDQTDAYGSLSWLHKISVAWIVKQSMHAHRANTDFRGGVVDQETRTTQRRFCTECLWRFSPICPRPKSTSRYCPLIKNTALFWRDVRVGTQLRLVIYNLTTFIPKDSSEILICHALEEMATDRFN